MNLQTMTKSAEPKIETQHKFNTTGHIIKSEDEFISLSIAAQSLEEAKIAISEGILGADELLDLSAEALDDAALSIKSFKVRKNGDFNDNNTIEKADELFGKVRSLALEILTARRPLLAISYGVGPSEVNVPSPSPPIEIKKNVKISPVKRSPKKSKTPLVVWASETGTSAKLASSLSNRMAKVCGNVECMNMKELTLEKVKSHKRVYVMCSTFGAGRPPRDGEFFFSSLKYSSDKRLLDGVEFAVASLGNSKFEFFAIFGQMISHEFRARGAEEIMPVTLFDRREGKRKQKKKFVSWEKVVLSEFQQEYNETVPMETSMATSQKRAQKKGFLPSFLSHKNDEG